MKPYFFQVTSKHDSYRIHDQSDAQNLLGRGDILFKTGEDK